MKTTLCRRLGAIPSRRLNRSFATTSGLAAEHARIVEVGPRDGLQNEKKSIPLETKLELLDRLAKTGVSHMEAGSFVPAKWVPQMASTAAIFETLLKKPPASPRSIAYNYLVPNRRGLDNLTKILLSEHSSPSAHDSDPGAKASAPLTSTSNPNEMPSEDPADSAYPTPPPSPTSDQAGPSLPASLPEISLFAAATETFSQKNTNTSISNSLETCREITTAAKLHSIRVRGYVSVALGCPYEGPDVPPTKVAEIIQSLLEMGCDEVSVADTTGMGTAPRTRNLLQGLSAAGIRTEDLALHFHDTYGQALVNTVVGLEHGVRVFDSSVGGLGGCPFSKGATGNVSTEDMVHLLHSLGLETGVSLEEMARVGEWITAEIGRPNEGRAGKALLAKLRD